MSDIYPKEITSYVTTTGAVFSSKEQAERKQLEIDFKEWYDALDQRLECFESYYSGTIPAENLLNFLRSHKEEIKVYIEML